MKPLISIITFIKNKNNRISTGTNAPGFSYTFAVPTGALSSTGGMNQQMFEEAYNSGEDVALNFLFVHEVHIESSFKHLTKKCKITFPRYINLSNIPLKIGAIPMFSRGDRVIVQLGYGTVDINTVTFPWTEVFRGFLTDIGFSTPLVLECEDIMFALKNYKFKYSSGNGKISLRDLVTKMFQIDKVKSAFKLIDPGKDGFTKPGDTSGTVPIVINTDTEPFHYSTESEKSIAEVLDELKKKLYIYIYFDDFGNLRFELPLINTSVLSIKPTPIYFNLQVIEDHLDFHLEDEVLVKVIFKSKQPQLMNSHNQEIVYIGQATGASGGKDYVGDYSGDSITVNSVDGLTQAQCNARAFDVLKANKYTGYKKGSHFTTFGTPVIYIGSRVDMQYLPTDKALTSRDLGLVFQEKTGRFQVIGVTRTFGIQGYRQKVELGIKLSD